MGKRYNFKTFKSSLKDNLTLIISFASVITIFGGVAAFALSPVVGRVEALEASSKSTYELIDGRLIELSQQLRESRIMTMLGMDRDKDGEYTGVYKEQIFELYGQYLLFGDSKYIAHEIDVYSQALMVQN